MVSLNDAGKVADELEQLVRRLHEELARGPSDLLQVVVLADEVAEVADSPASTFAVIDEQLGRGLAAAMRVRVEERTTAALRRGRRRAFGAPPPQRRALRAMRRTSALGSFSASQSRSRP
jgi:hypothetical protein